MAKGQTAGVAPAGCEVIGLDVSKDSLSVAWGSGPQARVEEIANSKSSIMQLLRQLPQTMVLGLESTGRYHRLTCDLAVSQGLTVYLLNPRAVKYYGKSVKGRAKTDLVDARVIARYVENERNHLRPYQEAPPQVERIGQLVRRRGLLTAEQVRWSQHMGSEKLIPPYRILERAKEGVVHAVDQEINDCFASEAALDERRQRLLGIPGVGPVCSAALAAFLARGNFTSADAFVAYIGLDLIVEDSGKHIGQRRLTKRGDPEMRRLLYNSARSVCSGSLWQSHYQACLSRGLSKTAALVVIARRIARTAWSMDHHQKDFCRDRLFKKTAASAPAAATATETPPEVEPSRAEVPGPDSVADDPVKPKSAAAVAQQKRSAPPAASVLRKGRQSAKPKLAGVEPASKVAAPPASPGRGSRLKKPLKRNVTLQASAPATARTAGGGDGDAAAKTL